MLLIINPIIEPKKGHKKILCFRVRYNFQKYVTEISNKTFCKSFPMVLSIRVQEDKLSLHDPVSCAGDSYLLLNHSHQSHLYIYIYIYPLR